MRIILAALLIAAPAIARADVVQKSDLGFVSRNVVQAKASPAQVWQRLIAPATWWASDHTFSGDAANLSIDPVPGGCFCEVLPADAKGAPPRGGVQHMRVVYVETGRVLRMTGALGPLQSEAAGATLTITVTAVDGGTRVIFEYVVGGYMRYPIDRISSAVDTMLSNQLVSLVRAFAPAGDAPGKPADQARGLDPDGVLLPRGRVWSLPAGNGAAEAPTPAPAAAVSAPLPTAPLPPDVAATEHGAPVAAPQPIVPQSGARKPLRAGKRPVPVAKAAPAPTADLAPAETPAPEVATPAPPAPRSRTKTRPRHVPAAPAPAPQSDEPSRDAVNSAVDAALGGPAPQSPPQR